MTDWDVVLNLSAPRYAYRMIGNPETYVVDLARPGRLQDLRVEVRSRSSRCSGERTERAEGPGTARSASDRLSPAHVGSAPTAAPGHEHHHESRATGRRLSERAVAGRAPSAARPSSITNGPVLGSVA